jgi:hypothetical protein
LGVTEVDELRPGHVKMWMLSSSFRTDDEAAVAFSVQRGDGKPCWAGQT